MSDRIGTTSRLHGHDVHVRFSERTFSQVRAFAASSGLAINGCVRMLVERGLALESERSGADAGSEIASQLKTLSESALASLIAIEQNQRLLISIVPEGAELVENTLVTTVMSNLGLHLAMREHGVVVKTTAVGDRYVLEALTAGGFSLGGEQSGHVVLPEYATTGDGSLTALRLMARMVTSGRSLAELASVLTRLPQVLINVAVTDKATVAMAPSVADALADAEAELGDTGRILLRPSGTEQLVRLMVEAPTESAAHTIARRIAKVVNFGIIYGIGEQRLAHETGISRAEAADFIASYNRTSAGVKAFMDDMRKRAAFSGYVSTLLNRRRYIPDIHSAHPGILSLIHIPEPPTP